MRRIPMVAVGPDDDDERHQWIAALTEVIDAKAFCLGAAVDAFEADAREALGLPHALGVTSGTDALRLALHALGVGPGSEVVVPAISFFASASTAAHLGARVVFADVDEETLTICPQALEAAITEHTRAVVPVHLYGQAARMDELLATCSRAGVAVVEDAAQCFGVRYRGEPLGGLGDAGAFSFYVTKNLAAAGDAGMVVCRDDELAERLRSLRVHGDAGGYRHEALGYNARMDGFQGAILSIRLRRLAAQQERRAANAERYCAAIEELTLGDRVRPLGRTPHSEHCWHQFIVRLPRRDAVRAALADEGIGSAVYYPSTLPSQPAFASCGGGGVFPRAELACREVLALPIHHRLAEDDPRRVVEAIGRALTA